jgi:SH3 domain-containing YSC84-like protein 1
MKQLSVFLAVLALVVSTWAQNKTAERVQAATNVLNDIMATPDKGIPADVIGSAKCVAVVPSMKKAGFVVGGNYGRGVATCRTSNGWSAPAPFAVEGGSWGLQIGGQEIDLVMLVMNDQGMQNLLNSKFKLGADASAAAGPVGRQAEASTDWKLKAQVLTYSRAKGAFAGVSLNGAVIKQDKDGTKELYGKDVPFRTILTGGVPTRSEGQPFVAAVQKYTSESQAQGGSAAANTTPAESSSNAQSATSSTAPAEANAQSANPHSSATPAAPSSDVNTQSSTAAQTSTTSTPSTSAQAADNTQPSTGTQSPGAALPQSSNAGAGNSSAQVQSQIIEKLKAEPGITVSDVNVVVTDDAVQVSGSVPSANDKAAVHRIAQTYAGSRRVNDDNLTVK